MKRIAAVLAALTFSLPLVAQEPIDYRFDEVRRKVTVSGATGDNRASAGVVARSGDRVQTGWFSYALLAAPRYAARFEIFAGSDVRLASDTPGVLLSLERGRLKAMFDKLTGEEPRMLRTPGALLAVRGTRYGIEVGRDGATTLAVFEGVVEVRSSLRPEPLLVHADEICHFSRTAQPDIMPMSQGMNEDMWNRHGGGMDGGMMPGGGMDGGAGGHGGMNRPSSGSGHHGH